MAALWLIHAEVLLVYIFATYREVSPFVTDCGSYRCVDGFCCLDICCYTNHDVPKDEKLPWFIFVIAIFGTLASFVCLYVICITCCTACKNSDQPRPQEPTRNHPIPAPSAVPTLPIASPMMLASDPPPYSEVVGKSYVYPAPVEQPPCYENIAMEDRSSLDITQHPGLMPKDNS